MKRFKLTTRKSQKYHNDDKHHDIVEIKESTITVDEDKYGVRADAGLSVFIRFTFLKVDLLIRFTCDDTVVVSTDECTAQQLTYAVDSGFQGGCPSPLRAQLKTIQVRVYKHTHTPQDKYKQKLRFNNIICYVYIRII